MRQHILTGGVSITPIQTLRSLPPSKIENPTDVVHWKKFDYVVRQWYGDSKNLLVGGLKQQRKPGEPIQYTQVILFCSLVSWGIWLIWDKLISCGNYLWCSVMYPCQDKGSCKNYAILLNTSICIITQGLCLNQITQRFTSVILRRKTGQNYMDKWRGKCPHTHTKIYGRSYWFRNLLKLIL